MKRKEALLLYLAGTLGQILLVSLLVWLLRAGGVRVDYGTPIGLFTLILGGLSSAIWGGYVSIRYHHSNVKQLVRDFFQVKQPLSNYLLVLIFLGLDFLPLVLSGGLIIQGLVFSPLSYFAKPLSLVVSKKSVGAIFPACFARKVDLSSVHTLYIFGLVTMAYPLFLH